MRAVVVPRFGGPEVLAVRDLPEPRPGPGQVSVAVEFAGVNYTDVRNRMGHGLGIPPFVPGVEVSGTVREVGSGVTTLRPGQPVAAFTRGHGYAEVALASEIFTVPLPDSLAGRPESAGVLVTVPVVLMLLTRVARVRPDELVLLHGAAGGVGTVAGQLAPRLGLRPLLGTAGDASKAEYAAPARLRGGLCLRRLRRAGAGDRARRGGRDTRPRGGRSARPVVRAPGAVRPAGQLQQHLGRARSRPGR